MAILYVRSTDGNNADSGATWALAKATIAGAIAAASAGDTIYVSQNHAESTAGSITLSSGTAANPTRIICANDGAEPPTSLATTATVTVTGSNNISFAGFVYCYGIKFISVTGGSGGQLLFNSSSPWWWFMEACVLDVDSNGTNQHIYIGNGSANADDELLEFFNSQFSFGASSPGVTIWCPFRWWGTPSSGILGTALTTLFGGSAVGPSAVARVEGVDLSLLGSGKNLVNAASAQHLTVIFTNCKLGSSVSPVTGTNPGQGGPEVTLVNCDSADTNYSYYRHCYQGTITHETTVVRTGGASDGVTTFGRKMVSSANTQFFTPLKTDWLRLWNTTLSSQTATVEILTDNVTLTDAECWLEVEYLGTSGYPLSVFATDRAADILATPANQTTSSETWTTTGIGTPVKQKLAVTFTPAEKGPISVRVCLAKASTTVYVDPKVTVS